jgi:hypothetical protein
VTATVTFHKRRELALEAIVGRFSKADGVTRAAWRLNPLGLIALSGKVRLSKACRRLGEAACANLSGRDREGRLTGRFAGYGCQFSLRLCHSSARMKTALVTGCREPAAPANLARVHQRSAATVAPAR